MARNILVTGGAGYIGSVVVEQLLVRGETPIVLDDLSTGHRAAVPAGVEFIRGNVGDRPVLDALFAGRSIDALMHFAAFALVAESVADPAKYHANNVTAGRVLLETALAAGVRRVIFSSSCTIYGARGAEPITEEAPVAPLNPYGETKAEFEALLARLARSDGLASVSLRYFNAAGATIRCGEDHEPETHLIPNVLRVAPFSSDTHGFAGITTVTIGPATQKVTVKLPGNCVGISFQRQDDPGNWATIAYNLGA